MLPLNAHHKSSAAPKHFGVGAIATHLPQMMWSDDRQNG